MTAQWTARVGINGQLLSDGGTYRSAGVSGYIRQLLTHLPSVAPDIQLTAFLPGNSQLSVNGMAVKNSGQWNTRRPLQRILWEQLALPALIDRHDLDLIHGTVNINPIIARCPSVISVHDLSFWHYPKAFPTFQRHYLRTMVPRSVQTATRVIAVSEATRQDVINAWQVSPERIDVVYNGVDEGFEPAPSARVAEFRRQKGLPERFILHLGTLEPRKNLVHLVAAFDRVKSVVPDASNLKLVLAGGKGWGYDSIFEEVAKRNLQQDVLFPGYVPDEELVWWYRAAAVFAYPSMLEGFGLPVLEAMASGTPTVTSMRSSLPEVAGDAAILVDPESQDSLSDALIAILEDQDLADRLVQLGLQQAARFSWQRTAIETAAVYRKALGITGGDS
ncbi:MAG: glycosyltransferase family 1 protein [Chloroflexota bacterium]|nr:glycosyltransferase family 1 protein [Chloroflexota bacterium]